MTDQDLPGSATSPQLDPAFDSVWDELVWRGSVHVSTDPAALRELLSGEPITYYCGFDPTAPSLHLGNLVQLIVMRRLQLAGHRPLGLVGGSTGLIGDPRPTAERTLNSRETVIEWVQRLQAQVSRFVPAEGENGMRLVNNLDWTAPLSAIDFLREIGKHFRVGTMLKKEAVSARLNSDAGISYTEFSYQILQGLDYLELYRQYGCVLQTGGSDQWGNLTSGTDLIHRTEGVSVHAIGTPLVMNSDGTKFGKSEGNAVWLDPELTSPYAFYQFWVNTDDRDVVDRLRIFTFLPRAQIERLERASAEEPFRREAQRALAWEVTSLVHGAEVTHSVIDASAALFGKGSLEGIDPTILRGALEAVPSMDAVSETPALQAFIETGLVASMGEARRAFAQGGLSVNNVALASESITLGELPLINGIAVLRRGKKSFAGAFVR
ncbi:tyrosine--tRNA ligase [Rathayibacter tritici]|uniref:Tyrosine--tRNA ligase n=1 Tax=Rathayibacter tritici TaxID=33888 RepID=A0A160KS68_9MICO|nr:tyrosine--tRNA ligase [Rathayibacter tritici]AND16184.1 tyrosine--tRNA ligase [Rathayibacter tritici]PPF24098.1 tyrosine--tRNA ligase [Rathayibacter tritici]PPF62754.1 tyrosine--tRNA ligase [Rathayibacter tritici]PPG03795.1 tyrosine--tRNA ligase [Rathayibacter tritici]PPI12434.1 tyrosine--tRNA ligase [Rathayibacter tritici]